MKLNLLCGALALAAGLTPAMAQPSAFTYQGQLNDTGQPANGIYDFQFNLYSTVSGGSPLTAALLANDFAVSNGLFTLTLDFGSTPFDGNPRWLEIGLRAGADTGDFAALPRQPLHSTPYAILAASAATATGVAPGAVDTSALQPGAVDSSRIADGSVTDADLSADLRDGTFWRLDGNGGTAPGAHFLGTTDNQPLEFKVNRQRGFRVEPAGSNSVNVIGGWAGNSIAPGTVAATIGGGGAGNWFGSAFTNRVEANGGTISGGEANTIQGGADDASISGGFGNAIRADAWQSTISGGIGNTIQDFALYSTISGGQQNTIETAFHASIGGGGGNTIEGAGYYATLGGGADNRIQTGAEYATIAGGADNTVGPGAASAAVGGGRENTIQAEADNATIGGGSSNLIQTHARRATIGGGYSNEIGTNAWSATLGGGMANSIGGNATNAALGGGWANAIQTGAAYAFLGGGGINGIQSNALYATLAGGQLNKVLPASLFATIGGGRGNTIQTNGECATIPGGSLNSATNYAFAAGRRAKANHTGAFVWGDSTDADLASAQTNSVTMRASGGYRLFSDSGATTGASLAPGDGSWTTLSDRNAKENFAEVSPGEVLEKVAALPVLSWNYWSQNPAVRHLGPVAQDFKAAFGLGASDTGIATVDADGVALAAIQGLNQKLEKARAENAALKFRLERLEQLLTTAADRR